MSDKKVEPKLCRNCKHSRVDRSSPWNNRCFHPIAVADDPWALSANPTDGNEPGTGVCCRTERDKKSWSAKCGMKGKLWEPKEKP